MALSLTMARQRRTRSGGEWEVHMMFVRASRLRATALSMIMALSACNMLAPPAKVTLANAASRACTGDTRVRALTVNGQPAGDTPEQTQSINENLSVRLDGNQYEIQRSDTVQGGQITLLTHIRPDGTVVDANLSGSALGGDQLQQLSMTAAKTLYERAVMGRELRPGDNLYANVDMQDMVNSMMGAMALPPTIQIQMAGTVPYTGTTGDGANRSFNFAGQLHVTGGGAANGQTIAVDFPMNATISIDATTGLMRATTTDGTMDLKVNGVTQTSMRITQNVTCSITTQ
jgi:hypothetical protein